MASRAEANWSRTLTTRCSTRTSISWRWWSAHSCGRDRSRNHAAACQVPSRAACWTMRREAAWAKDRAFFVWSAKSVAQGRESSRSASASHW